MIKSYLQLISLLGFIVLLGCSDPGPTAGRTVETTNGFSGTILNGESPAEGAIVTAYPVNYNPSQDTVNLVSDTTDEKGKYEFPGIKAGVYNIEGYIAAEDLSVIIKNVVVDEDGIGNAADGHLEISGSLTIYLGEIDSPEGGIIYIPGTSLLDSIEHSDIARGFLIVNDVPTGSYDEIFYFDNSGVIKEDIITNIAEVKPIEPTIVGLYSSWNQKQKFVIDTLVSLASLSNNASSYSLLLRLNETNFDFSQANTDGSDIRISDSEEVKRLSFEIERFEKDSKKAEIWVEINLNPQSAESQFIHVHTGKTEVNSLTNSKWVFDEQDWIAVWHFPKTFEGLPNAVDASINENHGGIGGSIGSYNSIESHLGYGFNFNDSSQIVYTSQRDSTPQIFTVSLWFSTVDNAGGKLLGFERNQNEWSHKFDRHIWLDTLGFIHFGVFSSRPDNILPEDSIYLDPMGFRSTLNSPTALNDGQWHHIVAGLSPAGQVLFIDGILVDSKTETTNAEDNRGYWRIGKGNFNNWQFLPITTNEGLASYSGKMDEVRISYSAANPATVRLDYYSQRPGFLFQN